MPPITVSICILFFAGTSFAAVGDKSDLISVAVYFRHGDRSPESSFPLDEHCTLEYFPMGFGQLTNQGINRQYELGRWMRKRYSSFLPATYSRNDIYVYSTDVDRTLMSAAANLAGLYPPRDEQVWNPNVLWRPIPIHTVPEAEDSVLRMKKYCARYEELYKEIETSAFFQEINKEYAKLYKYLSEHTGLDIQDMEGVKMIRSVLYVYENYNASFIPAWADSLDQTTLDFLSSLTYARKTFTPELQRLRTGPFFHYLISYFSNFVNGSTATPKFLMMSAHDTTMIPILDSMGVPYLNPPNFAATLIWELRRSTNGTLFINLLYKQSDTELLDLTVTGCEKDCLFDKFKKVLKPVTVDPASWEKECSQTATEKDTH